MSDQWIVSTSGAVGISLPAIDIIMNYKDIPNRDRLEESGKVRFIGSEVIRLQKEKAEAEK